MKNRQEKDMPDIPGNIRSGPFIPKIVITKEDE
jgi:hypothetical protein